MPKLTKLNKPIKALVVAESGAGKTGALACLANAGYKIWMLDFDNGTDILPVHIHPSKLDNVDIVSCDDGFRPNILESRFNTKGQVPKAYTTAVKACDKWPGTERSVHAYNAKTEPFGPDDILVIDSLSMMAAAAMRLTLSEAGRTKPEIQDWYTAQNKVEEVLAFLFQDNIACNVIVNTHVDKDKDELGRLIEQPTALGKALPPKIPRYFNIMLRLSVTGSGEKAKREFHNLPSRSMAVKCPFEVPATMPQKNGLLMLFKAAGKISPIDRKKEKKEASI